ncbi:MAG: cadherin-like domain-containing protein, partial [Myxococcota bacterium]
VVWSQSSTLTDTQDIYARRLRLTTQEGILLTDLQALPLVATANAELTPRVARVEGEHLIAWAEVPPGEDSNIRYAQADSNLGNVVLQPAATDPNTTQLPDVARSAMGELLIAWTNTEASNIELIPGQGERTVLNVRANRQSSPVVVRGVANDEPVTLVVWNDDRGPGLAAARIVDGMGLDREGLAITNATVTDDALGACANDTGQALVVWMADNTTLQARRLDLETGDLESVQTLIRVSGDAVYRRPSCAMVGDGAIVAWREDGPLGNDRIGSARLDMDTGLVSNIRESLATGNTLGDPAVAALEDTAAVVFWPGPGLSGIVGQRLSPSGVLQGSANTLSVGSATELDAVTTADGFALTWRDTSSGDGEPRLAWIAPDVSAAVPPSGALLNNDSSDDRALRITAIDVGHVWVVWSAGNTLRAREAFVDASGVSPFNTIVTPVEGPFAEHTPDIASDADGQLDLVYTRFIPSQGLNTDRVQLRRGTINRRPRAMADPNLAAVEDQTLVLPPEASVLSNDSDPDSDPLTIATVSDITQGGLTLSQEGRLIYTPPPDTSGSFTFTYQITDGLLRSPPVEATLVVEPVNDPPEAVADLATVTEDGTLTVALDASVLNNDRDRDDDPLQAELVDDVSQGELTFNTDGTFTYTPAPNVFGTDIFTYRATDGVAFSEPTTVTLTIEAVNDSPTAMADSYALVEDQPLTVNARARGVLVNDSDTEDSLLRAVVVETTRNGTLLLDPSGGLTYTPALHFF